MTTKEKMLIFFKELKAEDFDDFNVVSNRIGALVEELGSDNTISLNQLEKVLRKVHFED
ncbi:MAG: hypothetical protein ABIF19_08080 [Planctomycetota bacterium]